MPGCRGWPLGSGRRRPRAPDRSHEHRRSRDTGGTLPGRVLRMWNVETPPWSGQCLGESTGPGAYQASCIEDYQCTQAARGFSTLTIDNGTTTLERFLAACGRPAWEVTCEDIDRVVGGFAAVGMATSTRRGYVSVFKGFFSFLLERRAGQIESMFGVRLVDPVDAFNAARHVGSDSPTGAAADAAAGDVLRVPTRAGGHRAGVRALPHPISRRFANRGGGDARRRRPALRPRPVRQGSTCATARPPRVPGRGRGGCRC